MSHREKASALDRRRFLQALGLGVAGGSLAGCTHAPTEDAYALEKPPVPGSETWRMGEEKEAVTACGQCPAGCGLRVRVVEGRAVHIRGDEANPINRGGIGPRGLASLQTLYDPDRIAQPLRRTGARGSADALEPIGWDEAIALLGERLAGLRDAGEPHRLGVVCGQQRGLTAELFARFARAFGTPNHFDGLSRKHAALAQAGWLTQGIRDIPTYDWSGTRYVLSVGAGILESSCQSVYFARLAAQLRRPGARAKVVQVEPSPSKTAHQSDEWISIEPGSHAAFLLGLCHVLVREDLHDAEFVREHCFGFEPWSDEDGREHLGFWQLLLQDYPLDAVSASCGVAVADIERIGRELAANRPSVVVVDERATMAVNGLQTAWAAQALNALLGSIDRPGGVLTQRSAPTGEWPELELDEIAEAGLAQPRLDGAGRSRHPFAVSSLEVLPEGLLAEGSAGLDTLLLHYSNPLHSGMSPRRWRQALERVPFVVSFSPFLDETASEVADLVLPDCTYMERWEDAAPAPSVGHPVFGLRSPVVDPVHDTRSSGDVLLDLGRAIGGSVEEALDWKDFRTLLFGAFKGLHAAERGTIVEKKYRDFGRQLISAGWWADPGYEHERWDEVLRTPSGRFEFYSRHARAALEDFARRNGRSPLDLLSQWGLRPDLDRACLPHHLAPAWSGEPAAHPLLLEPYSPGTHAEGSGANLPHLQELVTERGGRPWSTTADISSELGRRLGLRTGDEAELVSPVGAIRVRVHLHPGMREDVVRVPRGGGHTALGRFAEGWGANVQDLLVPAAEPLGGCPAYLGTRVDLRRVES